MLNNKKRQLIEEAKLFLRYAVAENEVETATALVDKYKNNPIILKLFHEYYSAIPETREEAIIRIAKLFDQQGVCLVVVSTVSFAYLYALSTERILLLGEYPNEVDESLLALLGFETQEAFFKKCPAADQLKEYDATEKGDGEKCSICGVQVGEYHQLGCVVEVCPWCEGQISTCNCRFEQLGIDEIDNERQLDNFIDLLVAKGRIPFQNKQRPSYPGTSDGLD